MRAVLAGGNMILGVGRLRSSALAANPREYCLAVVRAIVKLSSALP